MSALYCSAHLGSQICCHTKGRYLHDRFGVNQALLLYCAGAAQADAALLLVDGSVGGFEAGFGKFCPDHMWSHIWYGAVPGWFTSEWHVPCTAMDLVKALSTVESFGWVAW